MKKLGLKVLFIIMSLAMIMCNEKSNVIITAHRGASGYAPENTIASIEKAIELKADYSELDVQETSDGEIIVLHDKTLKRTAGVEKNIWETSLDELSGLEAGSWFDEKYSGEPIPKFEDVIKIVKGKIKLNIELKTNGHEKMLADRTVKIVKDNNFTGQCIFTSFSIKEADRVKEIDPALKAGYIFSKYPEGVDVFASNMDVLSVHRKLVDKEFMKKAIANNKEVHVWTVNEEDEMKRLIGLGVASIITNYPDKLRNVLESM